MGVLEQKLLAHKPNKRGISLYTTRVKSDLPKLSDTKSSYCLFTDYFFVSLNSDSSVDKIQPIRREPVKVYLAFEDGDAIKLIESNRYSTMCYLFDDGFKTYDLEQLDMPCLINSNFKGAEYLYINPCFKDGDQL